MATRRSIQVEAFKGLKKGCVSRIPKFAMISLTTALAAGCRAVDEQAAFCNDLLAGFQITLDLDEIAIGKPGLDLAQLDSLVFMGDPDPHLIALIDQGLPRYADRRMIAGGIDRDIGKHLRLQA